MGKEIGQLDDEVKPWEEVLGLWVFLDLRKAIRLSPASSKSFLEDKRIRVFLTTEKLFGSTSCDSIYLSE